MKCGNIINDCAGNADKSFSDEAFEQSMVAGYMEMSRINLSLAELGLAADNEAVQLCEQNLRSVNECGS